MKFVLEVLLVIVIYKLLEIIVMKIFKIEVYKTSARWHQSVQTISKDNEKTELVIIFNDEVFNLSLCVDDCLSRLEGIVDQENVVIEIKSTPIENKENNSSAASD